MALRLVPPALVPVARLALQQQGINPRALDDNGVFANDELMALFFDTVRLETAFTNPVEFKVNSPSDPRTRAVLERIQPRITMMGRAGTVVIDPWGAPVSRQREVAIGAGAVIMGAIGTWMLYKALR